MNSNSLSFKQWLKEGIPWIWLCAAAVSASLLMVCGLIGLIAYGGISYFWPKSLVELNYLKNASTQEIIIGEIHQQETVLKQRIHSFDVPPPEKAEILERWQVKTGNKEIYGIDFRWINQYQILSQKLPPQLATIERREWGNIYGEVVAINELGHKLSILDTALLQTSQQRIERANDLFHQKRAIEKNAIGKINYDMEKLRLKARKYEIKGELTPEIQQKLEQSRQILQKKYLDLEQALSVLNTQLNRDSLVVKIATGQNLELPLAKIVQLYQPNSMNLWHKLGFLISKIWEFVSDEPREANTEGGIFPAIFGTILMVIIMSVVVTPFGVIAAVYLKEYAGQNFLTRAIRIAVNNLAGVPSIVYGVFGLGFFVYWAGGNIDRLFFPEALPSPTFGTPGLMWCSLTLALLTLPVVIVATEEGLARIPKAIREGSLALGATKAETLWRIVLPMASPALMTGLILAVARAAGEVAPLMLVGVVKLAPTLPFDTSFPFLHLDRKFMHLGFHIYDVGFQSPNVEAARSLVYATSFLLLLVIVALNISAIAIRNRLRERYKTLEN